MRSVVGWVHLQGMNWCAILALARLAPVHYRQVLFSLNTHTLGVIFLSWCYETTRREIRSMASNPSL
ncbi:uncharacterized protein BO87DRAFT_44911 [Aspergillus neoniger CBS 115656]|uniref:Uncharacterized protein n=1 Tax=Aspergillus neoniger (strain CBS 115656) TaxID=1448310 RepID=A0A318YKV8_ASPNB|nr:hypothetical protein BO87DRAFT_44911 [Aspergillus neoniger CBS 115656]PYH34876.1 hypothetical protein BO87DRAFT_44911 [Aspergillus neoniger CBS 115656]